MTNAKKFQYLSILIFCPVLAGLHINSSDWFRMKLADRYRNKAEYVEALRLYDKILRKDSVKSHLPKAAFSEISFKSGFLYSKLNLPNSAIVSYAGGAAGSGGIDLSQARGSGSLDKDRLLAVGLLEGAEYRKAAEEFRRLKALYPDFKDADRYMDLAGDMRRSNIVPRGEDFYFSIGDGYIQKGLFEEAREFFTKRILRYGIDPLNALGYLKKRYTGSGGVKEKVWGSDIYVTLQDFEAIAPALNRSGAIETGVNHHRINSIKENVYKGSRSEFLDVSPGDRKGSDSWERIVAIPLNSAGANPGIRLFVKSIDPLTDIALAIEVTYPRYGGGISFHSVKRDVGDGWTEHRIKSLFEAAEGMAKAERNNWDIEGMFVNKIILIIRAGSYKVHIDDIELCAMN